MLLKDRWPGHITWAAYQENQAQLAANRNNHRGVSRGDPFLLAGLLVCGHYGHRMVTCHRSNGRDLQYDCIHGMINDGGARYQTLSGRALDSLVAGPVLEVLRLPAVEVSLQLAEDVESERAQRHRHWSLRLEQARHEVERATTCCGGAREPARCPYPGTAAGGGADRRGRAARGARAARCAGSGPPDDCRAGGDLPADRRRACPLASRNHQWRSARRSCAC